MTLALTGLVLFAALLLAAWNALLKGTTDKTAMLALIAGGHVVPGVLLVYLMPAPDWASAGFIIASTVIHWAYYLFLNIAYRFGDLSLAYPIARGLAPVMIALGAIVFAGETLPFLAWCGIAIVSAGILTLSAVKSADPRALFAALTTSVIIAAYSIVDGIGIRLSGSPLGYIGWLFVMEIFVALFVAATRGARLMALPGPVLRAGLAAGFLSGFAYALVLYAKTFAPLGIVSALRETSVIFAALIGVFWFGERPVGRRLVAALTVVVGIVVLTTQ